MKVVLDTNIIVSATIVEHGHSNQIIEAWLKEKIDLLVSPAIIEEIEDVLTRPRIVRQQWMNPEKVQEFIVLLKTVALSTPGRLKLKAVTSDPDDDKFIVAGVEGGADYIVSGDPHLLEVKEYGGVKIVTPARFLKLL